MKVKIKGNVPVYGKPGDAGADLISTENIHLRAGTRATVPTGTWIEIPKGCVGLIHLWPGCKLRYHRSQRTGYN